jgi:hypothetical protein
MQYRMCCPECGFEGLANSRKRATEIVALANAVHHNGRSVAGVERVETDGSVGVEHPVDGPAEVVDK